MLASMALFIIAGGQHPPEATELEVKDAVALLPSLTRTSMWPCHSSLASETKMLLPCWPQWLS